MELTDWILDTMTRRLLLRMNLKQAGSLGREGVYLSMVSFYSDDDGWVMAHIVYDSTAVSDIGHMQVQYTAKRSDFPDLAAEVKNCWYKRVGWGSPVEKYVEYQYYAHYRELPAENPLVLQHLARVQGVLTGFRGDNSDQSFVVVEAIRRLGAVIEEGNKQLSRLSVPTV